MSKGLEALERNKYEIENADDFLLIKKELKALEIIKKFCILKVYKNKLDQCFIEGTDILSPISQKTYRLLKEVLL